MICTLPKEGPLDGCVSSVPGMRNVHAKNVNQGWSLYVLECSDGTFYTGITNDLSRRLAQHNSGRASRYTRGRMPVKLVHAEPCKDRSQALKRECALKRLSRSEKIARISARKVPGPPRAR